MEVEEGFLYTKEHEWVNVDGEIATIGISDYAQESLGDITFIELPKTDDELEQFEQFASIESVKAASDLFSPMSGKVIEVNNDLEEDPSLINRSCYGKGWIVKIQVSNLNEQSNLLTAEEYQSFLETVG